MDQLQNQLNQVLLMRHNAQAATFDVPHMARILSFSNTAKVPLKVTSIHSFRTIASMHSFIASNVSKSYYIWIIDSGATYHIFISLSLMHNITKLTTPIIVSLPNDHTTLVTHTGSVQLSHSLTLHNVLYIPTFTYNLISISRLLHKTLYSVTFTHDKFVFQDHNGNITN